MVQLQLLVQLLLKSGPLRATQLQECLHVLSVGTERKFSEQIDWKVEPARVCSTSKLRGSRNNNPLLANSFGPIMIMKCRIVPIVFADI